MNGNYNPFKGNEYRNQSLDEAIWLGGRIVTEHKFGGLESRQGETDQIS